jgi:hypothetical protein
MVSSSVRAARAAPDGVQRWHRARSITRGIQLHNTIWIGIGFYGLLLMLFTITTINGTSAGSLYSNFFRGADPRLLAGQPRWIRSDEWLVQTPLTLSQVQQGLPRLSHIVPGGVDVSVLWNVPYREWSTLFRPQMWAFFVLPLDHAFAFMWWLPAIVLGAAAYALLTTLWRRPGAALAGSLAFVFSGFFQWWYEAITLWPVAFALVTATCTIWMLRNVSRRTRGLLGVLAAYSAIVAVLSQYPAFLVPCTLAAAAFCLGSVLSADLSWKERLGRTAPLLAAGAVAGAVSLSYFLTRLSTVEAVLATIYPGQRRGVTGDLKSFSHYSVWAGIFGQGLTGPSVRGFAVNASEGSSFLFVGFFLFPSACWLIGRRWRSVRQVDWLMVALLGCLTLFLAFVYVPGWDAIAHVMLLDRTTFARIVIGLGLVSFFLLAVVVERLAELRRRPPLWTVAAAIVLVGLPHAVVLGHLRGHAAPFLESIPWWPVLLVGLMAAVILYALGRRTLPSVLLLVVSFCVSGTVNPLYRGVLDLRDTDIGREIISVQHEHPGTWLAIGDPGTAAMLRETAVESYSGDQAWPSQQMWNQIDPHGTEAKIWNRYAHIWWTANPGAPEIRLKGPDSVGLRFDSCSRFAQSNVTYVLTQKVLKQTCVRKISEVPEPSSRYWIYRVSQPTK